MDSFMWFRLTVLDMDVVEFTDERGSAVDQYTGTFKSRINCNGSSAVGF